MQSKVKLTHIETQHPRTRSLEREREQMHLPKKLRGRKKACFAVNDAMVGLFPLSLYLGLFSCVVWLSYNYFGSNADY